MMFFIFFFFSSRRRHTRLQGDWSSDVCSSDLTVTLLTKCPKLLRTLSRSRMPSTTATFIQPLPLRGGRGGGGGVISGGVAAEIIGGGGVWLCTCGTSSSILAENYLREPLRASRIRW